MKAGGQLFHLVKVGNLYEIFRPDPWTPDYERQARGLSL